MPLAETLITGVGTAIARGVLKLWLKDHEIASDSVLTVADILGKKTQDLRQQRATQRQFDRIAERAADSVLQLLHKEAGDLDDAEREFVANAAGATISTTPLSAALLAQTNLDPADLASHFRQRTGAEGGNPGISFSPNEREIYDRILSHGAQLIVDIASQFPNFAQSVFSELLQRQDLLSTKADQIITGMDRVLAAQGDGNLADQRFETDYRLACVRRFDQLELFGVDLQESNKRYKLSVAYITLEVERTDAGPGSSDGDLSLPPGEIMPVDRALATAKRLFVRGPAGSGKTTLLQWVAVFAAGRELQAELSPLNDCIPFFIRLRDFAGQALPAPETFPSLVSSAIGGKPADWAHRMLTIGRALVLIDGVDEISEADRDEVRKWLGDLTAIYPEARYVITSRPHAAKEGWLDTDSFMDASLRDLGRDDIQCFVDHWHDAVRDGIQDPDQRDALAPLAAALNEKLRHNMALHRLANSPLLCAIICALHRDRVQDLPANRIQLYRSCIEMFFRRDRERRVSMSGYLDLADIQKELLLQDFAWWMVRNGKSSASPDEADERFDRKLGQLRNLPVGTKGAEVRLLLIERVGILRHLSAGKIDFPHRTFQEYLAAQAAIAENDLGILIGHAHVDQWRETVILAAGLLNNADKADHLLRELLKRGDVEPSHRQVLYLVAAAAMDTVVQLPQASDVEKEIQSRLKRIIPPPSLTAAKDLAAAGDLVVPLLAYSEKWKVGPTAAAVRTLGIIGSEAAARALTAYAGDARVGVWDELKHMMAHAPKEFVEGFTLAVDYLALPEYSDLWCLRSFPNIRHLTCRAWRVRDIEGIRSCARLESIDLYGLQVAGIEALGSRTSLESLKLNESSVNDISSLSNCIRLKELSLADTQVTDISALQATTELKSLDISRTKVTDIGPLGKCTKLEKLSLSQTEVCDISPLRNCTSLTHLYMFGTQVDDIASLGHCIGLQSLYLRGPNVTDISPLASCGSLGDLYLDDCKATSIRPLANCRSLRHLYLGGASIAPKEISELQHTIGDQLTITWWPS